MAQKFETQKFDSLQSMIQAIHGLDATLEGSETITTGDFVVRYAKPTPDGQEKNFHIAHYCPSCNGFYRGGAVLDEKRRRLCISCRKELSNPAP